MSSTYQVKCARDLTHVFELEAWEFESSPAGPVYCPACKAHFEKNKIGSHYPKELRNA